MAQTTPSPVDIEKDAAQTLITSTESDAAASGTQTSLDSFESLRIFQELVGIRSSKQILEIPDKKRNSGDNDTTDDNLYSMDGYVNRPDPLLGKHNWHFKSLFATSSPANDGYYISAVQSEWKAFIGYQLSNVFITTVYVLQIFVAATITALAAYDGHRVTLTILGAINTVLAGLVAYTKGMGLPNRLRKSRDQYQHVKEYVDYKERQFVWKAKFQAKSIPGDSSLASLDPWVEAEQVRKLYEAAQKDEQANYPDIYVNDHEKTVLEAINADNREGGIMARKKANK
jgi:hypothetical protein